MTRSRLKNEKYSSFLGRSVVICKRILVFWFETDVFTMIFYYFMYFYLLILVKWKIIIQKKTLNLSPYSCVTPYTLYEVPVPSSQLFNPKFAGLNPN